MNYAALKTRIDGMSGTPAEIAASINGETIVVQGDCSMATALSWCTKNGILAPLEDIRLTPGHPLRSVAIAVMLMFSSLDSMLALSSPDIQELIGTLVLAGIMTADQRTALMALGQKTVPGWTPSGRELDFGDIERARAE